MLTYNALLLSVFGFVSHGVLLVACNTVAGAKCQASSILGNGPRRAGNIEGLVLRGGGCLRILH